MLPELYDMHCHVDLMQSMTKFCADAQQEKVSVLAVTTTPKAYTVETEKLSAFSNTKIALGLHPQLIAERSEELGMVEELIDHCKYVGEIGLDYNSRFYHSKEKQKYAFEQIISCCQSAEQKVISIHAVRSAKDALDILEKYSSPQNNACILHWFSDTIKQLERAIYLGCFFSVNEYMLHSPNGIAIVNRIPNDRLLIETDAPFISEIITAAQARRSLSRCLDELTALKGDGIAETIAKSSKILLL